MGRLIWNPTAIDDLQRVAEYVREHTPLKEQSIIGNIVTRANQLENFPYSGQKSEELSVGREVRTLLVTKHYRILYEMKANDDVTILQILDLRSDQEFYR